MTSLKKVFMRCNFDITQNEFTNTHALASHDLPVYTKFQTLANR